MLSKKQFDILTLIEKSGQKLSQRAIAANLDISLGTVNKVLAELTKNEYLQNGMIGAKGLEALKPHRVQRLLIFAAGFGSRLVPVTLNTPKPLVRVKGKRIIDTLLDAAYNADIEEIWLVSPGCLRFLIFFMIHIILKIVGFVLMVQPQLEPAQEVLTLTAGLGPHIRKVPDLAPAFPSDDQVVAVAAPKVDELQLPLVDPVLDLLPDDLLVPVVVLPDPGLLQKEGAGAVLPLHLL